MSRHSVIILTRPVLPSVSLSTRIASPSRSRAQNITSRFYVAVSKGSSLTDSPARVAVNHHLREFVSFHSSGEDSSPNARSIASG